MNPRCSLEGCDRPRHARGLCGTHYQRWRNGAPMYAPVQEQDGPGVCECSVSYPAPKCCTVCGFPSVYRMAPHIRDRALRRRPSLIHQQVALAEVLAS